MKLRTLVVAGAAVSALAIAPAANAATLGQAVSGTTLGTLALTAETPALFATGLAPGSTSTSSGGTLTAVDTTPTWNLSVKDSVLANDGHMQATSGTCTTSEPALANRAFVGVTPVVANAAITSSGSTEVTGADALVASATAVPLAATVFTTAYSQAVNTNELLQSGCVYAMTNTFTLG
jgi:hypothetical protein